MAGDIIKVDFLTKRSVMKSRFKAENYKGRWFILTNKKLSYYDGKIDQDHGVLPDSRNKLKGSIELKNIKVIEKIDQEHVSNHPHSFQIMYAEESSGDLYTLYIAAITADQREEWITEIRKISHEAGAQFFPYYHLSTYIFRSAKWNCCEKIQKQAEGCQERTWNPDKESPTPSHKNSMSGTDTINNNKNRRERKLPDVPDPGPIKSKPPTESVVAMFDYQKVEADDLSLEKGETYVILEQEQQFWWKAKNKKGEIGYIPANYVQKIEGDQLEQYDWFYPDTSRTQSEVILKREAREGCFLVRKASQPGMYTLSICAKESGDTVVKHYHIKKKGNGEYYLTERHSFKAIPELINYHKHNCAGLIVRLRSSPSDGKHSLAPPTLGLGHDKYEIDRSEIQLLEDLGAGQFGTVKLGIWKNKTKVAVKMMKEEAMSEDDFIDEAKTMKELQHKYLVQMYGVSTTQRPIFIITEFMRHGSLLSYLRRHKNRLLKKPMVLLDMSCQVSEAMEYLESMKFIHRDLAARNCLVGENDVCKVGDFGLARFVLDDEYTSSQGTKFPIRWAPPEVLSYTRFSTKSDVWSYGILMWEIFTGADLPYGRVKNQDVVNQVCHLHKRLDQPAKCPDAVYEIMLTCWEEQAETRPTFAEIRTRIDDILKSDNDYVD